eukprot:2645887-Ditylum_brightwellii.AAC.1
MTELATVDDRWADGSFAEDLLATEQTTLVFAECILAWLVRSHTDGNTNREVVTSDQGFAAGTV